MRGITEERLKEIANEEYIPHELLALLFSECKELNLWQPIETAPKDRNIIIYCALENTAYTSWWDGECYMYDGGDLPSPISKPELWQELPKNPE